MFGSSDSPTFPGQATGRDTIIPKAAVLAEQGLHGCTLAQEGAA